MLHSELDHLAGHLAAHIADLALQVADAGFARVVANDLEDRVIFEDDVLLAEARLLALLFHQVLACDLELLVLGVALQAQDFHAVLQCRGDGMSHICGRDKEDLREIVVDVEVVILEGRVLLRIEHFEKRRSRIAAKVRSHLVDFIEQEDGVLGPRPFHVLNNLTR